jgi:uncharacterized membrane protein YgcG
MPSTGQLTFLRTATVAGIIALFATLGTPCNLPAATGRALGDDLGSEPVTLAQPEAEPAGGASAASVEPAMPEPRPSLRYRIMQWLPRVGVFLMAMVILGFLAISALFLPPAGAWFIYLFLTPFLIWLPGMTLHPAAGWIVSGAWLVAFPLVRRWLFTTPAGERWRKRFWRSLARFEGDPAGASWGTSWSAGSRRSSGSSSRGGGSSGFSGGGGRFGGGGSSSRW